MIAALSRRVAVIVLALACCVTFPVETNAQREQQTQVQDKDLIPFDQLPPAEQISAPRLLVSAYVFVLLVLFLYLVSVARRLSAVQGEVERLETTIKRTGRS